jgi:hypothetical protein
MKIEKLESVASPSIPAWVIAGFLQGVLIIAAALLN